MPNRGVAPGSIPETLINPAKTGKCVLFLGAAIHAPPPQDSAYAYPETHRPLLGRQLARQLADECDFSAKFPNEAPDNLQRVSFCYEQDLNRGGRRGLVNSLDKHLQKDKKPSPILHMLADMPFRIVVTTNYDGLLERALSAKEKQAFVSIYDKNEGVPGRDRTAESTKENPFLFKIHGDLSHRESIVITDEDYITFIQRMSEKDRAHPVPQTVRYWMSRWPTLFVGYSLRDYNLRLLFRTLRLHLDPADIPVSYSVDRDPDPLIMRCYQDEHHYIVFLIEDIWTHVPRLYREVMERDFDGN